MSFNKQCIFDDDVSTDGRYGGKSNLRRGKWTTEEEAYANRLIQEFKAGLLPLTDGTTLRTFLSKLLNCDPMRISKKFVGQNCIGKQVFKRRQADLDKLTSNDLARNRQIMGDLEIKFLERLAQTNRCKSGSKDGKYYNDDFSNGPPVPWMIPPDPSPNASHVATTTTATTATMSLQSNYSLHSQDCHVPNVSNGVVGYAQSHSIRGSSHYPVQGLEASLINNNNYYSQNFSHSYGNPTVNVIENSSHDDTAMFTGGSLSNALNVKGLGFHNNNNNNNSANNSANNNNNNNDTIQRTGGYTGSSNSVNAMEQQTAVSGKLPCVPSHKDPVEEPDSNNLKRNQSIENFWMLVQLGDLPRPDEVVLVKGLWEEDGAASSNSPNNNNKNANSNPPTTTTTNATHRTSNKRKASLLK